MNHADIQVLATIRRTEVEGESSDKATIESHADKYWKYCENWSDADKGTTVKRDSADYLKSKQHPRGGH